MSAFIVGHCHIDALLTFVREHEIRLQAFNCPELSDANLTTIGRELLRENERSVQHRYPDDDQDSDAESYTFKPFPHPLTPVEAFKASQCLDYQSCEHDEWEQSIAYATLQEINGACARLILKADPAYERAPWGVYPEAFKSLTNYSAKARGRKAA